MEDTLIASPGNPPTPFLVRSVCHGIGVLLLAVLGACSPGENNVERGNREGVLYLGNGSEPQTIDPHVLSGSPEARVARALFEPLLTRNPYTEAIEPGVAERWKFSDDKRFLTFYLNPKARWSNGDPVTAEDFYWSWERAINPALASSLANVYFIIRNAEDYHLGKIDDFSRVGVEVLDSHTLRVELAYPYPFALNNFAYIYMAPIHRKSVEAAGGQTRRYSAWTRPGKLIGNGPFQLADWKIQRYLTVEQNFHYWDRDNIALKSIVFRPIASAATEEKMFRSGQLHATLLLPNNKTPSYRAQKESPLQESAQMASYYYALNGNTAPLNDRRVRRALALAIDRETLASTVLMDTMIAWGGYVPVGMPGYDHPEPLGFAPDEARRLMADAGFPDGDGFPRLSLLYNTDENHRTIAVAVQQMWKTHLNIDIELQNQEWQVYLSAVREGNFSIARRGWNGDTTPDSFLDYMVSDSIINVTGFANELYDDLVVRRARETGDVDALMALYQEAERILLDEAPIIPIATYTAKRLVQPSTTGMHGRIVDVYNYKYVSLDPTAKAWQWQKPEP
ncbi:MAG: peptide ABC transporter substrate-binding protein [Pseudomonadota bacterium]